MDTAQQIFVTNTSQRVRRMGDVMLFPGIKQRVPFEFITAYGYQDLSYDLSSVQERLPIRNDLGQPIIDWRSPLSAIDGYGRHAVWIIYALERAGIDIRVHDVGWVDNIYLANDIRARMAQANRHLPARINVAYTLGYDPNLYTTSSVVKIGITQFETDTLPRVHVENCNKLDHCVVTSSFQVKVFKDSGVTVPITAMTPGIAIEQFPYKERRMDGLFKVLIIGALTPRKNPLGAITIFQEASKENPDWRLTIKARMGSQGIADVERVAVADPRITVITDDDPPEKVVERYLDHHCLLWPSKGEGLGIPPMEAMATGMELVISDNSGMSDYIDPEWCYPIKMKGKESAAGPNLFTEQYIKTYGWVGNWWTPDLKHGAKQLEKCFNNWRSGNGKGQRAAEVMRERFTMDQSVRPLVELIDSYTK